LLLLLLGILLILGLLILLVSIRLEESKSKRENMPRGTIEKYWDGSERRRFVRFDSALDLKYQVRKTSRADAGRIRDISDGGLRMLADQRLESGTLIGIEIDVPDGASIRLEGIVVWCNEAKGKTAAGDRRLFHVGVRFLEVKKESNYRFKKLMLSLEEVLRKRAVPDGFSVDT
jgi:c-di-GMP-binding flagellar brake protein YcgR